MAIAQFKSGSLVMRIDKQNFRGNKGAIKTIEEKIDANRRANQPNAVDALTTRQSNDAKRKNRNC